MTSRFSVPLAALGLFLAAGSIRAQAPPPAPPPPPRPVGRVSFYANAARFTNGDTRTSSAELVTSVQYGLTDRTTNGLEFGIDARHSQRTGSAQPARMSVYDSYVGGRLLGGALRVRAGQMWLTDLGALGSVVGGLAEYRAAEVHGFGRVRAGAFGGVEPDTYEFGLVRGVRKMGAYVSIEGAGARRHTAGFVRISHGGLTERSVVSITNFVPVRARFFLYQIAEYDLTGPGGRGSGGLSYFFLNARATIAPRVEVQGLFNRGRSVDARTITDDLLRGRPVSASALDGLLYESAGGRVTVTIAPQVRVHAGYTRDRNNRDSASTERVSFGGSAQNVAGSGVDVTVSDSRIDRPTGRYHSVYASAGRQLGRSVYVSADYSSAVSIVRFTRLDGLTVEMRPETTQVGGSAMVTLTRTLSLFVNGTRTMDDDARELRALAGLTYRLR